MIFGQAYDRRRISISAHLSISPDGVVQSSLDHCLRCFPKQQPENSFAFYHTASFAGVIRFRCTNFQNSFIQDFSRFSRRKTKMTTSGEEDPTTPGAHKCPDAASKSEGQVQVDAAVLHRLIWTSQPARNGTDWIPRLKGDSNWNTWHESMKFHLERSHVLRYAETSVPRPEDEVELHL